MRLWCLSGEMRSIYGDARRMGVDQLLFDAASQLERRGWVRGVNHSPRGIDLVASLALAGGCRCGDLTSLECFVEPFGGIPEGRRGALDLAWELLQLRLGEDPMVWNDEPGNTAPKVIGVLVDLAGVIERTAGDE